MISETWSICCQGIQEIFETLPRFACSFLLGHCLITCTAISKNSPFQHRWSWLGISNHPTVFQCILGNVWATTAKIVNLSLVIHTIIHKLGKERHYLNSSRPPLIKYKKCTAVCQELLVSHHSKTCMCRLIMRMGHLF